MIPKKKKRMLTKKMVFLNKGLMEGFRIFQAKKNKELFYLQQK